ncbi:MAG: HAD-IG family 5'-nucleotidase [Polyangiales bacterium]
MQQRLPLSEIDLRGGSIHPPPPEGRIYCNRNLRMDQVEAVGFDMDYTLAIYRQHEMDQLSIEVTVRKLVDKGYPSELLELDFPLDFPIRGLLIDRKLGNVLKMDRYRYVKKAYHGTRLIDRDERHRLYHRKQIRPASRRYHWVDTLYALSEVTIFATSIDLLESMGRSVDYDQLFADIREAADLSHQDGSILDTILADLPRYIHRDGTLGAVFHKLRSTGKKLFLLTNSGPDYTDKMMTYLVGGAMDEYPSWRNYFDYRVSWARKPKFFTAREPFRLASDPEGEPVRKLARGRLYIGGNIADLEASMGISGDSVLYVGDHIYGDVVRAKKDSAWRTAMIIQEMDNELTEQNLLSNSILESDALNRARTALDDELREHQSHLKKIEKMLASGDPEHRDPVIDARRVRHRKAIDRIRHQLREVDEAREELESRIENAFHPFWGPIFKSGGEVSSFGDQVEQYACLYTARVGNFLQYSPMHYFRSPRDRMPHER